MRSPRGSSLPLSIALRPHADFARTAGLATAVHAGLINAYVRSSRTQTAPYRRLVDAAPGYELS
jgi:hypothetical protein